MNEILNTASVTGRYGGLPTDLTSKTIKVHLLENLFIKKVANKPVWTDGYLKYTITITNNASTPYQSLIITDFINPIIATLISKSVTINGVPANPTQYSFKSGNLKVFIDKIISNETITIEFMVTKRKYKCSKLENIAYLTINNQTISSNLVVVTIKNESCDNWIGCDKPYFGYKEKN